MLCLGLFLCYAFQWDHVTAVTVIPPWAWLIAGWIMTSLGWSRSCKWLFVSVAFLWLLYFFVFADEPSGLLRLLRPPAGNWEQARQQGKGIRVVSLNYATSTKAAFEVEHYHPDIVLFQESQPDDVQLFARRLDRATGGCVWGWDASIVARGRMTPAGDVRWSNPAYFVRTRVLLASGPEVEVVSLRLAPHWARTDFWSLDCWRSGKSVRQEQRVQMQRIVKELHELHGKVPIIVGGDFNSPPGDAIFRLLKPFLFDAYRYGGRGWCNTIVNEMPFARIDQIWVNDAFQVNSLRVKKTMHSDHRMVICDLIVLP